MDKEDQIDILAVDNQRVRAAQLSRLEDLKQNRNAETVNQTLEALEIAAREESGNLLSLAVEAARAKATVGEISLALEKVFGRHKAVTRSVSGIYHSEIGTDAERIKALHTRIERFIELDGRRPRILLAKMGQDGHDRGQKVIAAAFSDIGFDVDIGPLFQTPAETAKQAVENDVHIVGVSSLAAGHLSLVPALRAELKEFDREDILLVVGVMIPPKDYDALYQAGAAAIFGPGTVVADAANSLLDRLEVELAEAT